MKRQSKSPSTSEEPTIGLDQGRSRAVIENVKPEIDCGRFPAKRTVGESMTVEADIFADGHDPLLALLLYHKEGASTRGGNINAAAGQRPLARHVRSERNRGIMITL